MSSVPLGLVEKCIGARVSVLMRNSTEFDGILKGFDDYVNLVLDDVTEIQYDHAGTRTEQKLESSILLNGNAVTILVPGGVEQRA